tara:strand:- start:2025 stop:2432 length:408 start_codon:yes stop_codon:yes gene_type:complete
MKLHKMNCKRIKKEYRKSNSSKFNLSTAFNQLESGLIYTLYSDRFNSIEIGFAQNKRILETKLLKKDFILLDKKKGNKKDLSLLVNTLKELGINFSDSLNFKYSNLLIRHLSTLGWPIGSSLYKQRKIKKELTYA